ncbi:hypothetical protein [Kitasatospora sp. NPDC101183]|uniref:hypothetical protein n=1 Tax=Kitasatospora sp. NPDC101183 TaxID=3364100 RepID=UPI003800A1D2
MRRRLALAGVAVAGALVLTGCSGSHGDEAACPPPAPVAPVAPASPVTAAPAATTAPAAGVTKSSVTGAGGFVRPAAHEAEGEPESEQAAQGPGSGGKGSGSKGSGGKAPKNGRTVHHHIDHYSSNDGVTGHGHCHSEPRPTPTSPTPTAQKPGVPGTAPRR